MQERSPHDHRLRTVNYVPGEVCVVTSLDRAIPDDQLAKHNADLQAWLNRRIEAVLKQTPTREPRTAFERDLAPTELRRFVREHVSAAVLADVYGEGGRRSQTPQPTWISLPSPAGQLTTLLHFFAIKTEPEAQTDAVRDVVNLVTRFIVGQDQAADPAPARIVGATPNWLSAGTQHSAAGPAARPEPAPGGDWHFRLGDRYADMRAEAEAKGDSVTVAVLDTCPNRASMTEAATRYPHNALLQRVTGHADPAGAVMIEAAPSLPITYFDPDLPFLANWGAELNRNVPDDSFLMPDHGLFAAGIVRQIAPRVPIRLVRALSDYGVGDLLSLLSVLKELPAQAGIGNRLIINLSLVVDIPPSAELLRLWFPTASEAPAELLASWTDAALVVDGLHRSLQAVIQWLNAHGHLVVAAAGNDNVPADVTRPAPRLPARYDSVFAVAALRLDAEAGAEYSNRGDVVIMGNGVATLGGNANPDPSDPSGPRVINTHPASGGPVDALVGLYTQPGFPLSTGTPANHTGWAYWVGTSFATPIISGLAAMYWAANPGASATQVLDAVIASFATPTEVTGLDCPALMVGQYA